MKGLAPSATTRAGLSASRGSPAGALGDLRVTIRFSPPGTPPRTSYSSRSEHPVRFPGDFAGLSHGAPSISFSASSVDRMSIAASGDGLTSSEDEGAVGLPPSGVGATAAPVPELTAMLARAAVSIGLEVNRLPSLEPSRLDDWFLGACRERRPLRPSQAPSHPGSRRSGPDAGNPGMLEFALSQEMARTAPLLPPVEGREENLPFLFHFLKKEQFPFLPGSQVHGTTPCFLLTLAHDPFYQYPRESGTPLSCARRLLSSWQRTQLSRSLQPRGGRGFTALTSSYPRNVVAFDQFWICEF